MHSDGFKAYSQAEIAPTALLGSGESRCSEEPSITSYVPTDEATPASPGTQDVYASQYPLAVGVPYHSNTSGDQPTARERSSVPIERAPPDDAPPGPYETAQKVGRPIRKPYPPPHEVLQVLVAWQSFRKI